MSNIERAVADFMKDYKKDKVQMFDVPCKVLDYYQILYSGEGGLVRYCEDWNYIEILGANPKEYQKIFEQYGY